MLEDKNSAVGCLGAAEGALGGRGRRGREAGEAKELPAEVDSRRNRSNLF